MPGKIERTGRGGAVREKRRDTGASLVVPLEEDVWANKAEYSYGGEATKFFGTFANVESANVYALERSAIYPRPDGGIVLQAGGKDTDRQWLLGPVKGASTSFKDKDTVEAGTLLGTVDGSELKLALFVAPRGQTNFEGVDPVEVLQRAGAVFPDDLEDQAKDSPVRQGEAQGAASSSSSSTELAKKQEPKKEVSFTDILMGLGIALGVGTVVGYGVAKGK